MVRPETSPIRRRATDAERIGRVVRELRTERRASQAWLAAELGLSQGRLSEIERGKGSFTAEQLLKMLRLFNVGVERFEAKPPRDASPIQNALVRLGAHHLAEADILVPSSLSEPLDVVLAVLVQPESPRHLAALAPVLVTQADGLALPELARRLAGWGRQARLGWLLESVLEALGSEAPSPESATRRLRRRAATVFELFLASGMLRVPDDDAPLDLLDSDVRSSATAERILAEASPPAHRWRIVTRVDTAAFREALRAADAAR